MSNPYISPFAKPVYVMLKPVGSVCNLACEYCYYLEKGKLYPEVKNHIMSEQLLEKFIKEYLECQTMPDKYFLMKRYPKLKENDSVITFWKAYLRFVREKLNEKRNG